MNKKSSTKKILIMRHAKSSWEDRSLKDYDRPLNKRGKRDAPKMGLFLKKKGVVPNQVFSSTAARARATAIAVTEQFGMSEHEINWTKNLYFKGANEYLLAVRQAEDTSKVVMTVGHNPMTEEFIDHLAGTIVSKKIATATIACIETDAKQWQDVHTDNCNLLWITSPKDLDG